MRLNSGTPCAARRSDRALFIVSGRMITEYAGCVGSRAVPGCCSIPAQHRFRLPSALICKNTEPDSRSHCHGVLPGHERVQRLRNTVVNHVAAVLAVASHREADPFAVLHTEEITFRASVFSAAAVCACSFCAAAFRAAAYSRGLLHAARRDHHRDPAVNIQDLPVCGSLFSRLDPLAKECSTGAFFFTLAPFRVRVPCFIQATKNNPTAEEMGDSVYKLQLKAQDYSTEAEVYQEGGNKINIDITKKEGHLLQFHSQSKINIDIF